MAEAYDLVRFLDAQSGTYAGALAELQAGRKRSHWMWFVFPQLAGLGHSPMSQRYAIGSLAEARAYARHPILGARLRACCEALLAIHTGSARDVLGSPDDLKLRSSMTLFWQATGDTIFEQVLERYFEGRPDEGTLAIVAAWGEGEAAQA